MILLPLGWTLYLLLDWYCFPVFRYFYDTSNLIPVLSNYFASRQTSLRWSRLVLLANRRRLTCGSERHLESPAFFPVSNQKNGILSRQRPTPPHPFCSGQSLALLGAQVDPLAVAVWWLAGGLRVGNGVQNYASR